MAAVLGICLQLAAASAAVTPVFVPVQHFSLAWEHSIEKVRWEEDYRVQAGAPGRDDPVLLATQARIQGSAAGMEPPADAHFADGWYHYVPAQMQHHELRLTRSEFTADYQWCDTQGCRPMSAIIPRDGGVTLMWPCTSDAEGVVQGLSPPHE